MVKTETPTVWPTEYDVRNFFYSHFFYSTTHLSCGHKVLVIMNGEAENIISVSFVKSLLMTGWTADYSKCCHMEHYLIRLGVE